MKQWAGLVSLRVAVECAEGRAVDIRWAPDSGAHRTFEYARVFLVVPGVETRRVYLDLVDGRDWAAMELPGELAAGEYAIDVDAYGSASWGDGRLEGRGRSAVFTLGACAGGEIAGG